MSKSVQHPSRAKSAVPVPASRTNKGKGAPERFPARPLAAKARPDPFPTFVEPSKATLVDKPPVGEGWVHEIKWDGYRLLIRIQNGAAKVLTRGGHDWTARFPTIAEAAARLPVTAAMLDGEAVVENARGIPDFSALQAALGARQGPGTKAAHEAVLYAFDLLYLDGKDLRTRTLEQRRRALTELMSRVDGRGHLRLSEDHNGDPEPLWRQACQFGLEGIVSKRKDRTYHSGRNDDWLKVKCTKRQEFVIAGYIPHVNSKRSVGSLILGAHEDGELVHVGRAGTGYTEKSARELGARLDALRIEKPPFPAGRPGGGAYRQALWVKPELVAEIEFRGWTTNKLLRHASFKGLREDKPARAVVIERAADVAPATETVRPAPKQRPAAGRSPGGTSRENIQRLLPDAVVPSQNGLAAYWRAVGAKALNYLARRPLTLVRDVGGTTFFHEGPLPPIPFSVHQLRIKKRGGGEGVRLWVDDIDGLVDLVGIGVVEVHPWGATVDDIEHPDTLILDLDPGPRVAWEFVTESALRLREMLAEEGLQPWPKLTGGKGLHVVAAIEPSFTWEQARTFCRRLAERLARSDPNRYTATSTANRAGKIFVDYLRNGRGQTGIGAFSPRARAGFPVAMPVSWSDIEKGVAADAFEMAELTSGAGKGRARSA